MCVCVRSRSSVHSTYFTYLIKSYGSFFCVWCSRVSFFITYIFFSSFSFYSRCIPLFYYCWLQNVSCTNNTNRKIWHFLLLTTTWHSTHFMNTLRYHVQLAVSMQISSAHKQNGKTLLLCLYFFFFLNFIFVFIFGSPVFFVFVFVFANVKVGGGGVFLVVAFQFY